jgi:hypothetical protein
MVRLRSGQQETRMKISELEIKAIYPAQCKCGHIFLEKYQFNEVTPDGVIGFCWCGFCRTRVNVKPVKLVEEKRK